MKEAPPDPRDRHEPRVFMKDLATGEETEVVLTEIEIKEADEAIEQLMSQGLIEQEPMVKFPISVHIGNADEAGNGVSIQLGAIEGPNDPEGVMATLPTFLLEAAKEMARSARAAGIDVPEIDEIVKDTATVRTATLKSGRQ